MTLVSSAGSALLLAAEQPEGLEQFGRDPWWLIGLKTAFVFVFLVVVTLMMIWAERRIVARMQQRLGPNRVGPFGLGQGLADGIKLALKEDIIPALVDKPVFLLAPIISVTPAFLAFAVVPLGPTVSIFGHRTPLQLTDLPVAVLFVLAASSTGVYGLVLAGWSSGSTYPLLGGLRSAAQVISYEVALGLSLVSVFLYAGSLSTSEIVGAQESMWFILPLFPAFLIYVVSAVAEVNRAPFDLPEAEGELVGGFHTEYSSMKFAMFFLAEYINMTTVSSMAVTLFLGGWRPPPIPFLSGLEGWWGLLWFTLKLSLVLFMFIWLRGTLPRLRYDQLMKIGWKFLIPVALVYTMMVAAMRVLPDTQDRLLYIVAPLLLVAGIASFFLSRSAASDAASSNDDDLPPSDFPAPALPALPGRESLLFPDTEDSTRKEVTRA